MDSVICTAGNNNNRIKTRVHKSALARNSKSKQNLNRNNQSFHKNNRLMSTRSHSVKTNQKQLNNIHKNNINNVNTQDAATAFNNNNGNILNNSHSQSKIAVYIGNFTREVYNAICLRLGSTVHIPADSIQDLFNDMHLYPSKIQVSKMLQIARQCSRPNVIPEYLTFGEFCVFVKAMKSSQSPPRQHQNGKSTCEVFLGGSCNPTTWRADTAIPELQKNGISFYNPQVSIWAPELVAQEHDAKQAASVLLFVIDSQTRSTVGMIEVAYLVASGRCVVVVAQPYKMGQSIMGEIITDREYGDLVRVQKTLLSLVKSRGVKIHTNLPTALDCTANILRNSSNSGTSPDDQIILKLRKLREAYDEGDLLNAYNKLTGKDLEPSKLYNYLRSSNGNINSNISFERFCVLMAELTTEGCEMYTTTNDVWATQTFQQRQCSPNNNSCTLSSHSHIECLIDPTKPTKPPNNSSTYDIYLGGSMSSKVKWRRNIAIPLLKKHGLTYYNPAVREGGSNDNEDMLLDNINEDFNDTAEDVLEWKSVMDRSDVLLFIITNDTRSMTSMVLAAHYIGQMKNVILCVQHLPTENCLIHNETLSKNAIKDYNRARVYLTDLAKRKHFPVFENITDAVQSAIDTCNNR